MNVGSPPVTSPLGVDTPAVGAALAVARPDPSAEGSRGAAPFASSGELAPEPVVIGNSRGYHNASVEGPSATTASAPNTAAATVSVRRVNAPSRAVANP